jgi:hypothetical protein
MHYKARQRSRKAAALIDGSANGASDASQTLLFAASDLLSGPRPKSYISRPAYAYVGIEK